MCHAGQARPLPLFNCTDGKVCDDSKVVEQPANLGTLTARYTAAALEFVGRAVSARKPFLLYVPFNHVHAPNFASVAFCNTSKRGPVGDATQELDHAVGRIAAGVDALGVDEDTIWFFTSDNGAPLANDNSGNGPLRDGKMTTWEGGVREPAFVRWKGTIAGGRVTDTVAATYDIFATVLAVTGAAPPAGVTLDGRDLTPVLKSDAAPSAHSCVFHYWSPQLGGGNGIGAVRCGKYKAHFYVRNTGAGGHHSKSPLKQGVQDPPALFDLDNDMGESTPLDVSKDATLQAALAAIQARKKISTQLARGVK